MVEKLKKIPSNVQSLQTLTDNENMLTNHNIKEVYLVSTFGFFSSQIKQTFCNQNNQNKSNSFISKVKPFFENVCLYLFVRNCLDKTNYKKCRCSINLYDIVNVNT